MTDSMHYESRQIRDALVASDARLKIAKTGRLAADLQPQQGAVMLQEWEGLAAMGDLDQGNCLGSDNPLFLQMRAALLTFERELSYAAPARERAFFSALRAQLMEASVEAEEEQRNMHIAAAFKWFSRHKPQGPEADPITAAVLASSLSVEAVAAPAAAQPAADGQRLSAQGLSAGGPLRPTAAPSQTQTAAGTSGSGAFAAIGPGTQVKHQFFDVYSKSPLGNGGASTGGGTTSGATPATAAAAAAAAAGGATPGGARAPSARGPSPGLRASSRAGDGATSLSINHPLVMHPTVATGPPSRGGPAAPPQPSAAASAAAAAGISTSHPRTRFTSTELYAPGKLMRPQELDELDHRAAQVAAAAAAAGGVEGMAGRGPAALHPRPWVPGPHKGTIGTGGAFAGRTSIGGTRTRVDEEAEARALQERWTAMDSKASKAVADVQTKVAEWTLQRARLEEEIVRRQEAARFAPVPGGTSVIGHWRHPAGGGRHDTDDGSLPSGTLSPYANANADLAAATAAAASLVPGASAVSFILQPSINGGAATVMGASMRMRHADVGVYDRSRSELMTRLSDLGVTVGSDALDRALRPVEDRPFLDCIARLPKPGEHLASRPGSVKTAGAGKKKRSKSASKKRPTSGR